MARDGPKATGVLQVNLETKIYLGAQIWLGARRVRARPESYPWLTDGPTQSWADSCPWPDSSDYPSQENNQAGSSQDAPGTEAPPWSGPGPEPSKSNHNDSVSMFQCFMFLPKPPGVQLGGHKCRFKAVARGVGLWQGLSSTRRGPNGFSSHRFHFSFSDPKAAENGLQPLFSFNVSCDEWLFIIKVL